MTQATATRRRIPLAPQAQVVLPVPYYTQQQTNWCWAACTEMVITYFNTDAQQQCQIVSAVLNRKDCCNNPLPGPCNVGLAANAICGVYTRFHLGNCNNTGAQVPFGNLKTAINAKRVVEVWWLWTGGHSAHVVLAVGYDDDNSQVRIFDPWYGPAWMTYATVQSAGGRGGSWTNSWILWD
jgi:hypothetical protein